MSKVNSQCFECLRNVHHTMMYDKENCIDCAKDLGIFQQPSNIDEMQRVEMERQRVEAEQQEAIEKEFNKQEEAKREMAERALCRRRLLPFIVRSEEGYDAGWVHSDICQRLEKFADDVEAGLSPRLMITMPPRHGKSAIGSKTFPSWYLGRNPAHEVILSSYSGDLAEDFSRKCRDLIETPKYQSVFKTRLSPDSKSVKKWMTKQGGGFTAAGVGGPITGRGAHIGIIDDPVKNREEAESTIQRQKIKDWYSSAFYTRLAPGGGVLIIQTRWHEDDLAGWLLTEMQEANQEARDAGIDIPDDIDQWDLVEYPAIAITDEKYRAKGEPLHEARYPLSALARIKRTLIPRDWEALYQQRPVSDDGDYFTRDMFRYYKPQDKPPSDQLRMYAAADLAISTKQGADYSVIAVVGVDRQQNLWLIDIRRGQWGALGIIDNLFEIQQMYNPELFGIETGQIELTLEPFIQKSEQERGVRLRYEKLKTRGADKGTRARPIQGRMEQGRVFFPTIESTPWMSTVQNELLKFPSGLNDDIVDAIAWIGQMLMMFGIRNEKRVPPKKSFRDNLHKFGGGIKGRRQKSGMAA